MPKQTTPDACDSIITESLETQPTLLGSVMGRLSMLSANILHPRYDGLSDVNYNGYFDDAELTDEQKRTQEELSKLRIHSMLEFKYAYQRLQYDGRLSDEFQSTRGMRTLIKEAASSLINQALEQRRKGNVLEMGELLKVLVVVASMNQEYSGPYRMIIQENLQQELFEAMQTLSGDLVALKTRDDNSLVFASTTLPDRYSSARDLLELDTGWHLSDKWTREYEISGLYTSVHVCSSSMDTLANYLLLASGPNPRPGCDMPTLSLQSNMLGNQQKNGRTAQQLYEWAEELSERGATAIDFFQFSEPIEAFLLAEKFAIDIKDLLRLGRVDGATGLMLLDEELISVASSARTRYPDVYIFMKQFINYGSYGAEEMKNLMHRREMIGGEYNIPSYTLRLLADIDEKKYLDTYKIISTHCRSSGTSIGEVICGEGVYASLAVEDILVISSGERLVQILDKAAIRTEVIELYKSQYDSLTLPVRVEAVKRASSSMSLDLVPSLVKRLADLGIDNIVANEMFKSWNTYSAFMAYYFKGGFNFPVTEGELRGRSQHIAQRQAEMFTKQVQSLENCIEELGLDKTKDIISIFGIYNFARYSTNQLDRQLKRWKEGGPIENISLEARSDWNSFTKTTKYFQDVDTEVAMFEVNSPEDIVRTIAKVGKHSIEYGYNPQVKVLIINAHGDPDGMLLGVQGQVLDVDLYQRLNKQRTDLQSRRPEGGIMDRIRYHLGEEVSVVLSSCSTAGDNSAKPNIARVISEFHNATVVASPTPSEGVTIAPDGRVAFLDLDGDGAPIVYKAGTY